MFTVDPNITDLKVKDRNIFKILYSMNSPQVALPGYAIEEARCYILFFSEGPNLSSYIGIYLPRIDKKVFYTFATNPFPYEAVKDVEGDAREFSEEMGFLLDEINLSGMAAEDRNTWLEEQFIFGYRSPESTAGEIEPVRPELPASEQPKAVAAQAEPAAQLAPEVPVDIEVIQEEAPPQVPSTQPVSPAAQMSRPVLQEAPSQVRPVRQQVRPQDSSPRQPSPASAQETQPRAEESAALPVLEHPEEPAEAPPIPKTKPAVAQHPVQARKKPPAAQARVSAAEKIVEEIPVEVEYEQPDKRPRSLFDDAIREGVMKPLKQKAAKTAAYSPAGVVSREKEALARLLASF